MGSVQRTSSRVVPMVINQISGGEKLLNEKRGWGGGGAGHVKSKVVGGWWEGRAHKNGCKGHKSVQK